MLSNTEIIVVLFSIFSQRSIGVIASEVLLIPLHPHPSTLNNNKQRRGQQVSPNKTFQNSVVYDRIKILRDSGERGERLLTYYKQARFQQHEDRRRDEQIADASLRLGAAKLPSKDRSMKAVYPLFQGLGSHYCKAHVGTPPQVTTLLVDTGSEMTGFPCEGCLGCGDEHTNAYFDPEKSSTYEEITCKECSGYGAQCGRDDKCLVGVSYLEGSSWKGYEAKDMFSLAIDDNDIQKALQVPFTFACETSETGLFESQLENGIMGMMNSDVVHLPKVLKDSKKLSSNQFSLCLGWELSTSRNGVHSGIMTLGGFDDSHHTSPMVYVKNTKSFGYNAVIRNMYLQKSDGEILNIPAEYNKVEDVLIDSGTTLTYLSTAIGDEFATVWKNITGTDFTNDKVSLDEAQVSELPTVLIQLEGTDDQKRNCKNVEGLAGSLDEANCQDVIFKIPPSHYMFFYGGVTYTCELHFENQVGQGGIIGGNALQKHDVFFDNDKGRIGFAESDCNFGSASSADKKP